MCFLKMGLFSVKCLYLDYFQMLLKTFWKHAICSLVSFFISSSFLLMQCGFSNLTPIPQPWPAVKNCFSVALCGFWQSLSTARVPERVAATCHRIVLSWHTQVLFPHGIFSSSFWIPTQVFVTIFIRCVWVINCITIYDKVSVLPLNPTKQTASISQVTGSGCCQDDGSGGSGAAEMLFVLKD